MTYGTLARVALAGDAPRELQENVKYADWSPDGRDLVLVRRVDNHDRLELLDGTLVAEPEVPGGGSSFPRFSPDGSTVALFELNAPDNLFGRVVIVERSGARRVSSPRIYFNVFGLAWRGNEVWFTAAEELPLFRNTIYAMDSTGAVRLVARVLGNTSLHDIAPDGRLLIARTDDRSGIAVRAPDQSTARDLSWLDSSNLGDISRDGSRILFTEAGVGGGPRLSTYLRGTDGSAAVRLGDGYAWSLSPDGRWAIVSPDFGASHLEVTPTGAGQASRLERPGLRLLRGRWLSDGRQVLALAEQAAVDPTDDGRASASPGTRRDAPPSSEKSSTTPPADTATHFPSGEEAQPVLPTARPSGVTGRVVVPPTSRTYRPERPACSASASTCRPSLSQRPRSNRNPGRSRREACPAPVGVTSRCDAPKSGLTIAQRPSGDRDHA